MDVQRSYYTANYNTAGIYFEMKNYNTAYFYVKKILQYYTTSEEAKMLLVDICMELEKYEEAKENILELLENNRQDYRLWNLLSQIYQYLKEYDKSLESGWKAISISRGEDSQQINFGYLIYEIAIESPETDVKAYAKKWLEIFPDNPITLHMGNAMINAVSISQIDSRFVREIFDVFAEDFESVLHGLDYSVPSIMSDYLDSLSNNAKLKKMRILDAGCGTGLCGQYLKKYAKFFGLDGVDISEKMLQIAHAKKIYNHLYNHEVSDFLYNNKNRYDLINAADVYTYFGDLNRLFYLLQRSLKKGGRIIFSITENNINDNDYFLYISGRFVHKREYVEAILQKNGFFVEKINRFHLRNEGENKVYGWVIMALKN
jgi:predicted TPR repeat methyltransferase